ncbi:hypothetical protein A3Q56_07902 [Intoshia linei]|uniref:Uncharacterized protein n=1 Tax=Intoshia linei TaxID=1819745 RepID=A0A177AS88_9BILA|nr:hypothetical protein A3Q56_07902 [Intoshia linei]
MFRSDDIYDNEILNNIGAVPVHTIKQNNDDTFRPETSVIVSEYINNIYESPQVLKLNQEYANFFEVVSEKVKLHVTMTNIAYIASMLTYKERTDDIPHWAREKYNTTDTYQNIIHSLAEIDYNLKYVNAIVARHHHGHVHESS